ncbi:MAG: signal peptidase I [Bradymonadia bacterium]
MSDTANLKKARKRAAPALKEIRARLKKYGHTIDPARRAEVKGAADTLQTAVEGESVKAIWDALKALDKAVEDHMAGVGKSQTREYAESIGLAIVIALILRAFIIEAFTIPSGSMIPTLAVGDFLFVNKLSYGMRVPFTNKLLVEWDQPSKGDVIVFSYPCNPPQDFIKRVVAVPGDVVDITGPRGPFFIPGSLVVNDKPVMEDSQGPFEAYPAFATPDETAKEQMFGNPTHAYRSVMGDWALTTLHRTSFKDEEQLVGRRANQEPYDWNLWPAEVPKNVCHQPEDTVQAGARLPSFPWKIPEGHVMVMGDNRDNSSDSRVWGLVPMANIKGRALFIWLSWDRTADWGEFWNKIRWHRLGHLVHEDADDV